MMTKDNTKKLHNARTFLVDVEPLLMFLENPGKWIDEDSHEVLVSALSSQAKEKLLDGVALLNEILAEEMGELV